MYKNEDNSGIGNGVRETETEIESGEARKKLINRKTKKITLFDGTRNNMQSNITDRVRSELNNVDATVEMNVHDGYSTGLDSLAFPSDEFAFFVSQCIIRKRPGEHLGWSRQTMFVEK